MGRNKEPMKLILAKGKSHKTKKEIKEREQSEVPVNDDKIETPKFLRTKKEKDKFRFIAGELERIGIMSNLDCDEIGRYIIAEEDWVHYSKLIRQVQKKLDAALLTGAIEDIAVYSDALSKYEALRAKNFNQCHACASSLGLTITSRCRLVIPKPDEKTKENKFRKGFGTG